MQLIVHRQIMIVCLGKCERNLLISLLVGFVIKVETESTHIKLRSTDAMDYVEFYCFAGCGDAFAGTTIT